MKTGLLILTLLSALFIVYGIDSAHALEFKPLVAKNADNVEVSTGVTGEPIIFESAITNDEKDAVNFEVAFSTRTIRDKLLDHQIQSVHLKPGETTALTYQFVPTTEGNYVSGIFYNDQFVADTVTFPALDKTKNYQKNTVLIYSNFSDDDCLVACTDSSVTEIDVGTIMEFHNTTPDYRRISTGSYVEEVNEISWSSDDRFHSMIGPDKKSSFMFSQPGEYQLFLAEHASSDVIGTIHVLSDTFTKSDSTIGILQKIMEDKNSKIPITSLHVNPKNSVITVGIDDRKNPLFTLDTYKTMLYKQVGNVFFNIVADHTPKTSPCDVNDKVKVRNALDADPVVTQFLKYYPNATFEHFKTYDEPGNPRTYSEFREGLFLLRVLVLTYDQNGDCYPVYSYSISYDDPISEPRKGLLANHYAKSDGIQEAIDAVKKLSNPIRQYEYGISNQDISCKDGLVVLVNEHRQIPSCVTKETSLKLLERGWSKPSSSCPGVCENKMSVDDSQSEKVPVHDIRIEDLQNTYEIFEPIAFTVIMESYGIDHGHTTFKTF